MSTIEEEFIATVSHELRTPLTSIRGFSQTLLNSWDKIKDDDKKKFIGIIEEQSNRLIHLVENILTVSRADAEHQVLKKTNVNEIIRKIVPLIENQYKGHKYEINLMPTLPPALLDEDKFQQIMTNLVDNASKYSEEGKKVTISTEICKNMICIKVKDEGVGIKAEDYDKIFKKFSRLENHLTSKTQGNGLGLYITKQLVEKMNGHITFTSSKEGTIFEIVFPFYNEEDVLRCSQTS